jgi:integrase/recombinase XerD
MYTTKAIEGFVLSRLADGYSPKTMDGYQRALTRMAGFLENPDLTDITTEDIRNFLLHLRRETSLQPSSIQVVWRAIRCFYNWSSECFPLATRPDKAIPMPKAQNKAVSPFTEEETKRLLASCEYMRIAYRNGRKPFTMKRPTAIRDKALLLFLLDTGVRAGECIRMRVKDADLKTGEVLVTPFGSGRKTKSRFVYLGKSARRALWLYLSTREIDDDSSPLFLTIDDSQMTNNSIRLLLMHMGQRAEVKRCHPHRFRHTFAVQYLRNGGDVFTLQRILGHSTLDMVRRYLAIADADSAEAHRKASPADRWRL